MPCYGHENRQATTSCCHCHRPICKECTQIVVRGKIKNNSRKGLAYCPLCLKSRLKEESDRASAVRMKVRRELKVAALGIIVGCCIALAYTLITGFNEFEILHLFLWTYVPLMPAAGIWYYKFMGKIIVKYFKTLGGCGGIPLLVGLFISIFILVLLISLLPIVGLFRILIRLIDNWRLSRIVIRDKKQIEYLGILAADMVFTEAGPTAPAGALGSDNDEEIITDIGNVSGSGSSFLDNGEIIFRAEMR